jgi:hypothetical protein
MVVETFNLDTSLWRELPRYKDPQELVKKQYGGLVAGFL